MSVRLDGYKQNFLACGTLFRHIIMHLPPFLECNFCPVWLASFAVKHVIDIVPAYCGCVFLTLFSLTCLAFFFSNCQWLAFFTPALGPELLGRREQTVISVTYCTSLQLHQFANACKFTSPRYSRKLKCTFFIVDFLSVYLSVGFARRYLRASFMPPNARSQIEWNMELVTNIRNAIENGIRCPARKTQSTGSANQLAFVAF